MEISDSQAGVVSRIALGTAQFGMPYGVANCVGRPSEADARALVAKCVDHGITWFDTARAYGESEKVLGRIFADLGIQNQVSVIGKGTLLPSVRGSLTEQVQASLEVLGVSRFAFWLAHDERQLTAYKDDLPEEADRLRQGGLVGGFGISAYTPQTAACAIGDHGLKAVQFPASPFDRRFLSEGFAESLEEAGASLFVRSVFLQGLCLMEASEVPVGIPKGKIAVRTLADFCKSHRVQRDQFCLHYVLQRIARTNAKLVIGLECNAQLERNLILLSRPPIDSALFDEWDRLWPHDYEDLVLPYRWKI